METWQWILSWVGYFLALFAALILINLRTTKKKKYGLWLLLIFAIYFAFEFGFQSFFHYLNLPLGYLKTTLWTLEPLFLFFFTCFASLIYCKCDILYGFFAGTTAYCMQHISYSIHNLVFLYLDSAGFWLNYLGLWIITGLCYLACYFFFLKDFIYKYRGIDLRIEIIVSCVVVIFSTLINSYAYVSILNSENWRLIRLYLLLFTIMVSLLTLYVEFGWASARSFQSEKIEVEGLLEKQKEQYEQSKKVSELINIKAHDLKHQLQSLEGVPPETLASLKKTLNLYDSVFRTGSEALDVVLTLKSVTCQKNGIEFTCMIDGKALSFMESSDIYALFENIIDNAIEATTKLKDPKKKTIAITSRERNGYLVLHEENYFEGKITFQDGRPETTKEDKQNHGYGFRSIRYIIDKYHGTVNASTNKDIFELDALLPLNP